MEVDLCGREFAEHVIQQVGLVEALDNVVKVVGLHHLTRSRRKRLHVVGQVLLKVVRIVEQRLQGEVRGIPKRISRRLRVLQFLNL